MNIEVRDKIRTIIKAKRLDLGLKLKEVTAKGGYQAGMISRLENGKFDFTIEALIQISRGLDLKLKDILVCLGIPTTFVEIENEDLVSYEELGLFLARCRTKKGLSLRKLSGLIGLNYKTIFRLEHNLNSRISFTDIVSIDKALEKNGELISLAWRAGECHLGCNKLFKEIKKFDI